MQNKTEAGKKALEIKNPAIAVGIYGSGSKRLGDLEVTSKGLVWSKGTSKSAKDVTVKWDTFIDWMQSQLQPQAKTAKAPAKKASAAKTRTKAAASASATKTGRKTANGTAVKAAKKTATAKKAPAKSAAAKTKAASKSVH